MPLPYFKTIQRPVIFTGGLSSFDVIYTEDGDSTQWNNVFSTVNSLSAGWGGEFGTQGATAYTILQTSSANWNSVYATVSTSSGTWDMGGGGTNAWSEITGTPTTLAGYGITDAVDSTTFQLSGANWNSTYTTVSTSSATWNNKSFSTITDLPSTLAGYGITDAVDSTTFQLSGANWNSTYSIVDTKKTNWDSAYNVIQNGGSIGGNLTVNGNITATGTANYVSTNYTTTTALSITTDGAGPALWVQQDTDFTNIASFYSKLSGIVLYIGKSNDVGINTLSTNNLSGLTVSGNISASNIIYSSNSNSSNWTSVYNSVQPKSANWDSSYTTLTANSANWKSTYTTVEANSSSWQSTAVLIGNFNLWNSTYTTVNTNSAKWNSSYTTLTTNSADWISKNNTTLSALSVTQNVAVTGILNAATLSANQFVGSSTTTNAVVATSYNILSSDNGKIITLDNTNAITVNVLSGLGAGFSVSLIQLNTGQVTVSAGTNVTLNSLQGNKKLAGQYAGASLYAYASNTFVLNGALSS